MEKELLVIIFYLTMVSIALAILNFIALFNLKERQELEEVSKFIKVIILLASFGVSFIFCS